MQHRCRTSTTNTRQGQPISVFWRMFGWALAFCLAAATATAEELHLNLVETDSGRILHAIPVRPGEAFTLWFLHSYDRAFFAEHYRVEGVGRICLTHMTFKSNLNGGGFEYNDFYLHKNGVGELRHIDEIRPEVHFMMGSADLANHTLILRGRRRPLIRYAPTGTLVSLRVCRAGAAPTGHCLLEQDRPREPGGGACDPSKPQTPP